ncbi:MAG: transcriptional repressor [Desulfarculales bacterium]|jgi:Fur family ferric uptake transcriptional regulator|nr:transcriptional repressor [Desulfarculales bacterium]
MTPNQLQGKTTSDYQKQFLDIMKGKGRRATRQRLSIVGILYATRGHPTVEELHDELKKSMPGISRATVYRTVKLLKDAGLVMELHGDEGMIRIEAVSLPKHHDHLICRQCGAVMEIRSPQLEKAQSELAREWGFFPEEQSHCIYGLCSSCHTGQGGAVEPQFTEGTSFPDLLRR